MRQKNEREDQEEGVQYSGKTGTGLRDRNIDIEGKYNGGRRNANAKMDVRSYGAGQDNK